MDLYHQVGLGKTISAISIANLTNLMKPTPTDLEKLNLLYKIYSVALINPECLNILNITKLNFDSEYITIKKEYELIKHLSNIEPISIHYDYDKPIILKKEMFESLLEKMKTNNEKDMLSTEIIMNIEI